MCSTLFLSLLSSLCSVLPEENREEEVVREGHGMEVEAVPVLPEEAIKEGHGEEVEEKEEDIDWEGDQSFLPEGESSGEGGRRERRECQCCEIL